MRRILGFILHRNFTKDYSKLGNNEKDAFLERRTLLLIDPNHPLLNAHPLKGKYFGYFSINVTGDIRAVFKIEGFFAIFYAIGTHVQLYK